MDTDHIPLDGTGPFVSVKDLCGGKTPEEEAVLEAAIVWEFIPIDNDADALAAEQKLSEAVTKLLRARRVREEGE